MAEHRKPPLEKSASRRDGAPLPSDSGGFSIESTTLRLRAVRLRRQELTHDGPPNSKVAAERNKADKAAEKILDPTRPAGRVRHDARGQAVWDWAVETGEFATLSTTRALKKLDISELKIEEAPKAPELSLEVSGRDTGGGFDPYNQRGIGRRTGEAASRAGVTGAVDKDKSAVLDKLLKK
jgi:hypothetical protein